MYTEKNKIWKGFLEQKQSSVQQHQRCANFQVPNMLSKMRENWKFYNMHAQKPHNKMFWNENYIGREEHNNNREQDRKW